ncbi:hypothetical protein ACRRTK_006693 [Alexandromys fortis]
MREYTECGGIQPECQSWGAEEPGVSPAAPQKKKQTFVVQAKEIVEMLNEVHKTFLGLMAQQ